MGALYNAKRYFTLTNVKDNLDRIGAVTSAIPTLEPVMFIAYCQGLDGSTEAGRLYGVVEIIYDIIFSELKDVPLSNQVFYPGPAPTHGLESHFETLSSMNRKSGVWVLMDQAGKSFYRGLLVQIICKIRLIVTYTNLD